MEVFTPVGNTVNLAVTTTTGRVALTATTGLTGVSVRVYNAGAATAFLTFGTSTVEATTAAGMPVPSGSIEVFAFPAATVTDVAGITSSGTATVYFTSGRGA